MSVIPVPCPGCSLILKAPESMAGKKAKCKKCGTTFRIPGSSPPAENHDDGLTLSGFDAPEASVGVFDFSALTEPASVKTAVKTAKPPEKKPSEVIREKPRSRVDAHTPLPPLLDVVPKEKTKPSRNGVSAPIDLPAIEKKVEPSKKELVESDSQQPPPTTVMAESSNDPFAFEADPTPSASKFKLKAKPLSSEKARPSQPQPTSKSSPSDKSIPVEEKRKAKAIEIGIGKLLLLVVVFGLVVGGVVGGVLIFLNGKKEPEQARSEKKDSTSAASEVAQTKTDSPETSNVLESKEKEREKPASSRGISAKSNRSRESSRAENSISASPLSKVIEIPPKTEPKDLVQKPETTLGLAVASGAIRKAYPPLAKDVDPAVLWQSKAGFQGLGEKLTLSLYSSQTSKQIASIEVEGDGKQEPVCDLSMKADLFAHALKGKITIYNTRDKSKLIEGFDPYADKPEDKKAGLAAIYLTEPPDRLVSVTTTGSIHVWDVPAKTLVGEFIPTKPASPAIQAGKSVSPGPGRQSVLIALDGKIFSVSTKSPVTAEIEAELGGQVGKSYGLASNSGRIVYVFETTVDGKKEKNVVCTRRGEGVTAFKWPEGSDIGEPISAGWAGDRLAVVGTTRGTAVWFEFDENTFRPFAFVRPLTLDKATHLTTDDYWLLMPDPASPKDRSLLINYNMPLQLPIDALSMPSKRTMLNLTITDRAVSK